MTVHHPAADRPDRGAPSWSTRLAMVMGGVAVTLTMTALTPVLPQIDTALAHTAAEHLLVKLMVTITGVTMILGAPLAGFLSDRVGVRPVILMASLVLSVGGVTGLFLSSLPALLVSRLFVGAAAAALAATSMTLINRRFEGASRAKWMGIHVAVGLVASLFVHPAAGMLGEIGWRWPFLLYAFGFLFAPLGLIVEDTGTAPASAPGNATPEEPLWRWFPFRYILLALCLGTITYLPMVYIPFVMRKLGIESPLIISLIGLGDTILATCLALLFARAKARASSSTLFAISFGCAAGGLLIAGLALNVPLVIAGMMVYGLGLGWFVPNLMTAAAARVSLSAQGRTVGLVKAGHYLAAPACVILIDPLTMRFGPTSAILFAAGLSVILLLLFGLRLNSEGRGTPSALDEVGA